jgi:hypothetical protein
MEFPHVRATQRLIPAEFKRSCQMKLEENELLMLTISLEQLHMVQMTELINYWVRKKCLNEHFLM